MQKQTSAKNISASTAPIKILFVGDMMFDRYIRESIEKRKDPCFPFAKVSQFLKGFDMVIGNNEGPITDNSSVSIKTEIGEKQHLIFTFDESIARCYQQNNIKIVGIGNNHIKNFGSGGIRQTISALNSSGIKFFGNPLNEYENYIIQEINDKKIGMISYNYAYGLSGEEVSRQIIELKSRIDMLVVFAHWGQEYIQKSNFKQRELAHKFINAGADVVIGMHPHVIQDEEIYNGKHVFYSLGNFIFDQYFSKESKNGMGIILTINPDKTMIFEKKFFENTTNGQVIVLNDKK